MPLNHVKNPVALNRPPPAPSAAASGQVNLLAKWSTKAEHATSYSKAGPPIEEYSIVTDLEEDVYSLLLLARVQGANSPHIKVSENVVFKKHISAILLTSFATGLFTLIISISILTEFKYSTPSIESGDHCEPISLFSRVVALVLLMFMIGKEAMDIATFQQVLLLSKHKGWIDRTDGPFKTNQKKPPEPPESAPDEPLSRTREDLFFVLIYTVRCLSCLCVTLASVAVVHFAENGIEVFKDCVTFVFITEIDSLILSVAKKGLLGERMLKCSNAVNCRVGLNLEIERMAKLVNRAWMVVAAVGVGIIMYTSCVA